MTGRRSNFWNDARVARLRSLAGEGLKAAAIGDAIGANKNKVIGACRRFGVDLSASNGRKCAPRTPRTIAPKPVPLPKRPAARTLAPNVFADRPSAPLPKLKAKGAGRVSLLDLEQHHCRYPFGDHAPFMFCGETKREQSSYCPAHSKVCEQIRVR